MVSRIFPSLSLRPTHFSRAQEPDTFCLLNGQHVPRSLYELARTALAGFSARSSMPAYAAALTDLEAASHNGHNVCRKTAQLLQDLYRVPIVDDGVSDMFRACVQDIIIRHRLEQERNLPKPTSGTVRLPCMFSRKGWMDWPKKRESP